MHSVYLTTCEDKLRDTYCNILRRMVSLLYVMLLHSNAKPPQHSNVSPYLTYPTLSLFRQESGESLPLSVKDNR